MIFVAHSAHMTVRHLLALVRQPWYVAVTLVQPLIWLLLFGSLFGGVVNLPGFDAASYLDFLTPGIVIMSAIMSGGWGGIGMHADLDRGVIDRFLVSPASRGALIAGPLAQQAVVVAVQSVVIIALALLAGAAFPGGFAGIVALVVAAVLIGAAFAGLANALVLLTRKEESLVILVQLFALPLTFMSTAFMPLDLIPDWIARVAPYNPANWAVVAGREALAANPDWGLALYQLAYLAAFAALCGLLATAMFRAYRRSQ